MAAGNPDFYHPHFVVTVPAGTIPGNPLIVSLASGRVVLDDVEFRVPPGPSGNVGFRILWAGKQLVPWSETVNWLVADDEKLTFQVGLEVDAQLDLLAYNVDVYDHSFYVRLTQHDVPRPAPAATVTLLPAAAIDVAADVQS